MMTSGTIVIDNLRNVAGEGYLARQRLYRQRAEYEKEKNIGTFR